MSLSTFIRTVGNPSRSSMKMQRLKRRIIKRFICSGNFTIAELSRETDFSIPTVTKIVNELLEADVIFDLGKVDTQGGRRPNTYGINSKCAYYLGVEVGRTAVSIALQDLKNEYVNSRENIHFTLENTRPSLEKLCSLINSFIADSGVNREDVIGACINLSGRVNSNAGLSYNFFFSENEALNSIIKSMIDIPVYLENDTRAMAYGEFKAGVVDKERDVIFVNMSWGLGIGIIIDGRLYYGKSGYSGEFGHSPVFDNNILCQCGKKGCLETEISGWALVRDFKEAIKNGNTSLIQQKHSLDDITMEDIMAAAVEDEDVLAIDFMAKIGEKMGRYLSILINIFNPELVVIGGSMASTADYMLYPLRSSIKKFSLNLVSHDCKIKISKLGRSAGVVGACYVVRERLLDMLD
ncbi:MAG: ROK family transcriptional regulator [Dysgonamonadaceae bacterium]|nr:ROK family transcriptional regulator [Dysgonamonadaceae bacterium]